MVASLLAALGTGLHDIIVSLMLASLLVIVTSGLFDIWVDPMLASLLVTLVIVLHNISYAKVNRLASGYTIQYIN